VTAFDAQSQKALLEETIVFCDNAEDFGEDGINAVSGALDMFRKI